MGRAAADQCGVVEEKRGVYFGHQFSSVGLYGCSFRGSLLFQKERRKGWLLFDNDLIDLVEEELSTEPPEVEGQVRALESCLKTLKSHDMELIQKRYMLKGSLESYARELGRSVGTLKTRLHRLRSALRKCVRSQLSKEATQ